MDKARSALLFILLCTLAPVPAHAQSGQINAISVSPSPAQANQAVAITVDVVGAGTCAFKLDFGDGESTTATAAQGPVTHAYHQTQNWVLTATPAALFPCTGSATVTLPASQTTGIFGALYCALYGCNPTISAMPLSLPEPGNTVIFQGSGFGLAPGTAWIVLRSYGGQELRTQLQIDSGYWQPGVVVATIPPCAPQLPNLPPPPGSGCPLSGVVDQTATFQLVTAGESGSNGYNLPFTAWRDYQDIVASRIGCSMTKNSPSDYCQNSGGNNYPLECGQGAPWLWGVLVTNGYGAYHASGWQLTAGANDAGVDTFSLIGPLLNGWLVSNADFGIDASTDSNSFAYILNPPNLYFGGPTANPSPWQIGWNVSACGAVEYSGDFYIYGPIGVPY